MKNLSDRFAILYGANQESLLLHSLAVCVLMFALSLDEITFGVTASLLAVITSAKLAEMSILRNVPSLMLLSMFALSGLFNDLRLSAIVGFAACLSTPGIAAIGNRGIEPVRVQTIRILSAWLPMGLTTASLAVLAIRDRPSVALLLVLVYFHDLGLQFCARPPSLRRFAPFLAIAGSLSLLWAAVQVSIAPISPSWFWPFAALLGVTMPVSRLFTKLVVARRWQPTRSIASYIVTGPVWTAAMMALGL
ncbi:MAG: hypothetical protein QF637_02105 [Acidimicrobiales bacterium]|nr:hypothetical protein [Acidimicrobiales bacterium]